MIDEYLIVTKNLSQETRLDFILQTVKILQSNEINCKTQLDNCFMNAISSCIIFMVTMACASLKYT